MLSITPGRKAEPSPALRDRLRSPLAIGVAYVALSIPLRLVSPEHQGTSDRTAAALTGIAAFLLICGAWAVITFLREDDTVAAGVLFGLVVALGGLASRVLATMIADRGAGGGILLFMIGLPVTLLVFIACALAGAGATTFCRGLFPEEWKRWAAPARRDGGDSGRPAHPPPAGRGP